LTGPEREVERDTNKVGTTLKRADGPPWAWALARLHVDPRQKSWVLIEITSALRWCGLWERVKEGVFYYIAHEVTFSEPKFQLSVMCWRVLY